MFCSKCGQPIQEGSKFCGKCGSTVRVSQKTNAPGNPPGFPAYQGAQKRANKASSASPASPAGAAAQAGSTGYMDKYEDGGVTVMTCITGIVLSILALCTFSGKWVTLKLGIFGTYKLSLLEFSKEASSLASIAQYFDSDATTGLKFMSTAATLSYWVLLLGALVAIVVSVMILLNPKFEKLSFITYVLIIAFAITGLVFTAPMVFESAYFGVTALPIVMLVCAGLPAVILKMVF